MICSSWGPVDLGEGRDRSLGLGGKAKCGTHDGELSFSISRRPERTSHRMLGDEGSADPHVFRHVPKALDIDTNRRKANGFKRSLYMSN